MQGSPDFDVRAFAVSEWEYSHDLLDMAHIPRLDADGSAMSLSQRIERLFAKHNLGGLHATNHNPA